MPCNSFICLSIPFYMYIIEGLKKSKINRKSGCRFWSCDETLSPGRTHSNTL